MFVKALLLIHNVFKLVSLSNPLKYLSLLNEMSKTKRFAHCGRAPNPLLVKSK